MYLGKYNKERNKKTLNLWMWQSILIVGYYTLKLLIDNLDMMYFINTLVINFSFLIIVHLLCVKNTLENDDTKDIIVGVYCIYYIIMLMFTHEIVMVSNVYILIPLILMYNSTSLVRRTFLIVTVASTIKILQSVMGNSFEFTIIDSVLNVINVGFPFLIMDITVSALKFGYKDMIKLEDKTLFDTVTGAKNRYFLTNFLDTTFMDKVSEEKINELSVAVIDIDEFRDINNNYSYRLGDIVLNYIANSFIKKLEGVKESHLIRLNRDRFILVSASLNKDELHELCNKCCEDINNTKMNYMGEQIEVKVSIGIANSEYDNMSDFNDLYIKSTLRLAEAKKNTEIKVIAN